MLDLCVRQQRGNLPTNAWDVVCLAGVLRFCEFFLRKVKRLTCEDH